MEQERVSLPPLLQDRAYEEPADLAVSYNMRAAIVERERLSGFPSLNAVHQQIALDFVLSGMTIKALAKQHEMKEVQVHRLFGDPLLRAFISELQKEMTVHRLLTEQWVEVNILKNMPKFEGEEAVPFITKDGEQVFRKKWHAKELVAIFKHFGGNPDQKKAGGVHVNINFEAMGVTRDAPHVIDVEVTQGD